MSTQSIHPELQLGTVKLKVSVLNRSLAFYEQVIGFRVLKQNGKTAELTANGVHPLVILEQMDNAVKTMPRTASGLYHYAILLPSRQALGVALRRLIETGIHIGQADHLVSEALYISDPDHNGIEIYRDRPRESWKRDARGQIMMTTDPIDWDGLLAEAKDVPWSGLPAQTRIGHVHFHVSDLPKAKQFYCDLLGFDMVLDASRQMGALFISAGGYHHHIGLNVWAGIGAPPPPPHGTGLAYYTIVMPDRTEMERILTVLNRAGIEAVEQDNSWRVKDPSQIEIRFVCGVRNETPAQ